MGQLYEQLIFAVNNLAKDDTVFHNIRLVLQKAVERCVEFTTKCPSVWLIFSLILRAQHKSLKVLSYSDCFSIAMRCGMYDRIELNNALYFIHTRLGLVRYFCTEKLNKRVIVDTQILFDIITSFVNKKFVRHGDPNDIIKFETQGILSKRLVIDISRKERSLPVTIEWVLNLLTHLKLVAVFVENGEEFYFFPSVLCRAPPSEHTSILSENEPPPLLIGFKSGYCPRGIPGTLITYLMVNPQVRWKLRHKKVYKNQVSLNVGRCDIILSIFCTHLEFKFDPVSVVYLNDFTEDDKRQTCEEAFKKLSEAMKVVAS